MQVLKMFLPGKSHPDFEQIMEQHKDSLAGVEGIQHVQALSTKLSELGYDVLFNDKKKAEFVPASRLGEVASQRDTLKTQVETLNSQLQVLKDAAKGNETLQGQLQELMDKNTALIGDLEKTKVETEILLQAKDAIDPKDILPFVNREKIKVNSKGEITGAKEEIDRLRTEKPHLFGKTKNKGGSDNSSGDDDGVKGGAMNFLIRRAAGVVSQSAE